MFAMSSHGMCGVHNADACERILAGNDCMSVAIPELSKLQMTNDDGPDGHDE